MGVVSECLAAAAREGGGPRAFQMDIPPLAVAVDHLAHHVVAPAVRLAGEAVAARLPASVGMLTVAVPPLMLAVLCRVTATEFAVTKYVSDLDVPPWGVCTVTTAAGFYAFIPTPFQGVAELGLCPGEVCVHPRAELPPRPGATVGQTWAKGSRLRGRAPCRRDPRAVGAGTFLGFTAPQPSNTPVFFPRETAHRERRRDSVPPNRLAAPGDAASPRTRTS